MPRLVAHNETTASKRRVYIQLVGTDGITPATGETGQPEISLDGASWTSVSVGSLVEIGNGRYYFALSATHFANVGTIIETRYKSATTAECPGDTLQVGPPNEDLDEKLDALPSATAAALANTTEVNLRSLFDGRSLTIYQGMEVSVANGNNVDWSFTTLPDLTGGAAKLDIVVPKGAVLFTVTLTLVDAGQPTQKLRLTMTADESSKVKPPEVYSGVIMYKTASASNYSVAREIPVLSRRA